MYTIKEVANMLNISRQAVYKKVNKQLTDELTGEVFKKNNSTYITDKGIEIIRKSLTTTDDNINLESVNHVSPDYKSNNSDNYIEFLKQQIDIKDKQIMNQQSTINSLIDKIGNMQILLKQEQDKNLMVENKQNNSDNENNINVDSDEEASEIQEEKEGVLMDQVYKKNKWGFWKRIFKK